jgi:hypothetical protein
MLAMLTLLGIVLGALVTLGVQALERRDDYAWYCREVRNVDDPQDVMLMCEPTDELHPTAGHPDRWTPAERADK